MTTSSPPPYVTPRPQDSKTPYETTQGESRYGRPAGRQSGVPGSYVIMYIQGIPITVDGYVRAFGSNGHVYPGMSWDNYWDAQQAASQHINRGIIEDNYRTGSNNPTVRPNLSGVGTGVYNYAGIDGPITNFYSSDGSWTANLRGGGRGGGGGAAAPTYMAPDRAMVEEQVKAYLVAVTGMNHPELLQSAVDAYMSADQKSFDAQLSGASADVDPVTAMKAVIRGSAFYETIHSQRPESVDELEWVTTRQAKFRQLGLSSQRSEQLGITAAQGDANDEAIVGAAEMQHVGDTGRLLEQHKQKLQGYASAALRMA